MRPLQGMVWCCALTAFAAGSGSVHAGWNKRFPGLLRELWGCSRSGRCCLRRRSRLLPAAHLLPAADD